MIKFFSNFSKEKEILKLVATTDNFEQWSNINTSGYNDFIKQIKTSLDEIDSIPNKSIITGGSLEDYLSKIDAFKNEDIRRKVINLILREYKPGDNPYKKSNQNHFDFTYFKEIKTESSITWTYKDVTIICPLNRSLFFELDELNLPENLIKRRKHNYSFFYTEEKFNKCLYDYGITFYFVNYDNEGSELNDSKTILFIVFPNDINISLLPYIKYNTLLLHNNKFLNNIYVVTDDKPNGIEIENLIKKYDLEHILLPLKREKEKKNFISKVLNYKKK